MKKMAVVAAAVAAAVVAQAAQPDANAQEREKAAQAKAAEKASREKWRALREKNEALVRKDFSGGFANYWHDAIDEARANYEAALKDPAYLNEQKLEICQAIANCRLEATRDEEGAIRDLEAATRLPGLTEKEREIAAANLRKMLVRMRRAAPDSRGKEAPKDAAAFAQAFAQADEKRGIEVGLLGDYLRFMLGQGFAAFSKDAAERLRAFQERWPKQGYYSEFWNVVTHWRYRGRPSKAHLDPAFRRFVYDVVTAAPERQRPAPDRLFAFCREKGDLAAEATALAPEVVARAQDPKARVRPETLTDARRCLAFKDVAGKPDRAIAACAAFLREIGKADDKAELAKALAEQAREFLAAGDEKGARRIWAEREKIVPPRDQSVLPCPWWEGAPHDIRGIVESDFYRKARKGLLTHRYGDNLKFLIETDSAITGREMTTDKGEKFRPAELFAFCDRDGVKLLLRAYLENMDDVRAGYAGVPGYETYLATGIDDPYHCILFDPKEGGTVSDNFVTQYDNGTGYRNLRTRNGNLRYDNLYLDDSAATLISVPWGATFASIPSESPSWYFEAINWAHGGLSWGGSVSVHHRSSFGELKFTGVGARELAAIKRTVLNEAKRTWERAKSARTNGSVEIWMDPVLGDQAFYLAEVKPLVERISADAAKIGKTMTDEEAVEIYDRSAETMLNVDYVIAAKRRAWLDRRMTE